MAVVCNAVMDNVDHHWYRSRLNDIPFFNPKRKAKKNKRFPVFINDGWHFTKALMIGFLCVGVGGFTILTLMCWVAWWFLFELFYSKILDRY